MTKDDRETLRQLLDAWTEGQVSEPLATKAAVALPELLADSERLEQVREWVEQRLKANAADVDDANRNPSGSSQWTRGRVVTESNVLDPVLVILSGEGRG